MPRGRNRRAVPPTGAPMLCIAMKEGGIVRIGDDVDIFVQHIGGGQVRLCLSVPKEIPIRHLPPESAEARKVAEPAAAKASRRR